MTEYFGYLLIMELRFDAMMMYSKLVREHSDAGHIKCSRGTQVPPQHPCRRKKMLFYTKVMRTKFCRKQYQMGIVARKLTFDSQKVEF